MKNKRGSFNTAIAAMAKYSMVASHANLTAMNSQHVDNLPNRTPYLSKLEAIASSAVRAADKVRQCVCVVSGGDESQEGCQHARC